MAPTIARSSPEDEVRPQTEGRGRSFAVSTISRTFCSHSMAMIWMPATPSIARSCSMISAQIAGPRLSAFPLGRVAHALHDGRGG